MVPKPVERICGSQEEGKSLFFDGTKIFKRSHRKGWGVMQRATAQPEGRRYSVVWWHSSGYFCISCQMAAG